MKTEVWFDCVDDDRPSLKFTDETEGVDTAIIVIPTIGEKVGIWHSEGQDEAYQLHYVVDVRHYVLSSNGGWLQEIHVMVSEHP